MFFAVTFFLALYFSGLPSHFAMQSGLCFSLGTQRMNSWILLGKIAGLGILSPNRVVYQLRESCPPKMPWNNWGSRPSRNLFGIFAQNHWEKHHQHGPPNNHCQVMNKFVTQLDFYSLSWLLHDIFTFEGVTYRNIQTGYKLLPAVLALMLFISLIIKPGHVWGVVTSGACP